MDNTQLKETLAKLEELKNTDPAAYAKSLTAFKDFLQTYNKKVNEILDEMPR